MKNKDILKKHELKLTKLNQQSNNAVDLVSKTIENLQNINNEIDTTVAEINDYKTKLDSTQLELQNTQSKNNKIIANFKALLN